MVLECCDISVSFGEKQVLSGCSINLKAGEKAALMSPSGCGKTTYLRVMLSLLKPDSGTVLCNAERIGAVFQEPCLLPWCTALQNVNLVLSDSRKTVSEAAAWLEKVELVRDADRYPAELSGGMQQRISLARALAVRPQLLVLDEPFKGMDDPLISRMIRLILSEVPGAAIVLSTHRESDAEALGCSIYRYRNGCFSR